MNQSAKSAKRQTGKSSQQSFRFKVSGDLTGTRLDQFIALQGIDLSKRKIKEVIDAGGVYINRKRARIASRPVNAGDMIEMQFNLENLKRLKQKEFELSDSEVLYNEKNIIAVNKPPGLPAQATRDQSVIHLEAAVKKYLQRSDSGGKNIFLVHRLDKETSGVILLARNQNQMTFLTDQFRSRTVKKEYLALCRGIPEKKRFEVDCFLSPIDKRTGNVRVVTAGGKPSFTKFEVLTADKTNNVSLIRCFPETGRSHQIRVHLASVGLPIIGDKRYHSQRSRMPPELESLSAIHHFLHARRLTFIPSPDETAVTLTAELPTNFKEFLGRIFDLDDLSSLA